MATTPRKTLLEHSDELLELQRGAWIITTGQVPSYPSEGGVYVLPAWSRLRVEHCTPTNNSMRVLTEEGKSVRISRENMRDVKIEGKEGPDDTIGF